MRSALAALLLGYSASVLPGVVLAQEPFPLLAQGIESKDTVQVGESHEAVLGVTLSARPNGDRTVTAVSDDPGAVTVSPKPLTFTTENWGDEQPVYINSVQDDDTNDESVTLTLTLSGDGLISKTVTVAVRDDDTQGIESKDIVQVGESHEAVLGVTLSARPNGDRTVTAVSDDPGAVTVSPGSLTFTPENWEEEQSFNIIPVRDDDTNDESVTLTLSSDGLTSKTVTVEVTDDDTPPPDDDPEPVPAIPLLGQLLLAGGLLRLGVMRLSRRGGAGT